MKQKKMLALTLSQLEQLYRHELPELVNIATQSDNTETFKTRLLEYIAGHPEVENEASKQIRLLIEFDGREVHELSTGKQLSISTLSMLYSFLTGQWIDDTETDLFIDLFQQFKRLRQPIPSIPSAQKIKALTKRWPTGLDEEVQQIQIKNKERILHALIQKIEHRKHPTSHFHFEEGISYEEKYRLVNEWWNDFRFHLAMAIKSPTELNRFLGNSLSAETMYLLSKARKKGMPFFATPYYLSLLNCTPNGYDDEALRSYILYSPQLVETYGQIHAWEREDIVEEGKPNAAGWLLPDGHNIHRRYPEVAILIPDTMGRACGGLCASCQRMYDFQSKRLNFEFDTLHPKESWEKKLRRLMNYFEEDAQLRDILITGGDALMSQNKTLRNILDAVYRMAARKRKANEERPEGEKYAELQRIRLGSRLPAYLPMRINDELVEILKKFKEKASTIGIRQFIIQTHFQTPLEVTPEAAKGIHKLLSAGWLIDNQLVYNVAASRRGHTARLRQILNQLGVVCYYTFSVKGFEENNAVFTPNSRSVQEQQEEKYFGKLSKEDARNLSASLETSHDPATCIRHFLKTHHLPFLATDRNVLNLPAIGKSMTFKMVGITDEGKRILCFDHDNTRRHSPIINRMGQVYIVENKSIASYLRQLQYMGEDAEEYATIWNYTEGKTEYRFSLYEYPDFPFQITEKMTNLEIA
ncbi:KamA family radical SAM protein [Bacteroides helcogenes]|uniref:L-lysine 2,3-aminomutase n=1 Tax=Bacteroides helcogenes (strain ATCC 35417 / DSM 20613 / JCM 6297 / CCUG 15421 / P 36-108) TaxID=693979 RepID=E6SWB0_BACT6|nr:L-lysine 2,3-aminomutase [Bacteroides helcogenes]ADV43585.1 L-lysine 2,3-aminomutase [Bacteroides helcogenes P 36-108]MDY5239307.1 KamA family protein [Bacteroides helcogenes]